MFGLVFDANQCVANVSRTSEMSGGASPGKRNDSKNKRRASSTRRFLKSNVLPTNALRMSTFFLAER